LSVEQQKAELLAIFNRAVQLKLNVLVFQVRPACDVFYASAKEPWSEFLTGRNGKAPDPYYDPLSFAVEEAHRRGLELHAWFNPFRVRVQNAKTGTSPSYMTQMHPHWVRNYGAQLWLDPGLKAVRDYCTSVIVDVVKRYDVDGIHLDDYFYPYPEKNFLGQILDFPDEAAWKEYQASGGRLSREDWRRHNIDLFVEGLYKRIKAEKRWVKFGISPFGIWRPGFPKQIKGFDAYDHLYADSQKWLSQGWLDYCAPQLYWSCEGAEHSYPALLNWWASQNPKARHLWPGNDLTKVGASWTSSEIVKQVRLTRKQPGAGGNLFWSMTSLMRDDGKLSETLARELFTQTALVPASPWLNDTSPGKPKLSLDPTKDAKQWTVSWNNNGKDSAWLWVCQTHAKGRWTTSILPGRRTSTRLPAQGSAMFPDIVALTAVDRCGRTSPTALLNTETAPKLLTAARH
jgi:uncharacterized lipoprotein YddW (UPF0748 family)